MITNKPVFNIPDVELRENCWRYKAASESLETTGEELDWQSALGILQGVAQHGTTWSVIYSPSAKDLHFSVYQDWDTVYRVVMP